MKGSKQVIQLFAAFTLLIGVCRGQTESDLSTTAVSFPDKSPQNRLTEIRAKKIDTNSFIKNVMFEDVLENGNIKVINASNKSTLTLHGGFNWISVPRLDRTNGTTPTPTVFHQNNVSPGYEFINIDYNDIKITDPAFHENIDYARWDINLGGEWQYGFGENSIMKNISSTRGYVVVAEPKDDRILLMDGVIEDPATVMELYCKKENWIGYFIPEEQNVFDALAGIKNKVYHIQHENYNCWRYNVPINNECDNGTKSVSDYPPGTWVCNGKPVIKYGEMIKVSPFEDILNFTWNWSANPPSGLIRPEVQYYVYDKLADYETFVLELDTTGTKPTEISAFVNDSCVGACSVLPSDSVVVLSAYLNGLPGDSVVFEQHFGSSKMSNQKMDEYYVKNNEKQTYEKRVIRTGEEQEAFIISFKVGSDTKPVILPFGAELTMYPNPAGRNIFFDIKIGSPGFVSIEVYDFQGRKVKTLLNETMQAGGAQFSWDLKGQDGTQIPAGAYLVKLSTDKTNTTKKLIVQ